MKGPIQFLYTHPSYGKVAEWGRMLTITGSAQVLTQGIALVCGILVIRLLPTNEYALYTLANTMLGTMVALADGGIASGVLAQGGKVWQNRRQLGVVMATGLALRRTFTLGSMLVALPALVYLLRSHGAGWPATALLLLSIFPSFLLTLANSLLQVPPKLRQDIPQLQKNQVAVNIGRLLLLLLTLFTFPLAFVAILAAGLPLVYGNQHLRSIATAYAEPDQPTDPVVRRDIVAMVRRTLPAAVYYCLSGQLTIWLISLFGSTTAVAEVGALGRLVIVLTLLNGVFTAVVLPRFARLTDKPRLLLTRFGQLQVLLLLLGGVVVALVWLFAEPILWVLGPSYAGLGSELVLNMAGSYLSFMAGCSFFLCTSRGWVINPAVSIPISLVAIVCGVLLIDVSTLRGILTLNLFMAAVQVVLNGVYGWMQLRRNLI